MIPHKTRAGLLGTRMMMLLLVGCRPLVVQFQMVVVQFRLAV